MRPRKGGGQLPSSNELTTAELDYLAQESQLQSVRDSVEDLRTAQELIRSQNESFQAQNDAFQARLLEEFRLLRVETVNRQVTEPEPTPIVQFGNLPTPQLVGGSTSNAMGLPVQGLGCLSTAVADSPSSNPLPPTSKSSIVHSSSTDIVNGNSVVHLSRGKGIITGNGSPIHDGDRSGPSNFMNDACKIGDRRRDPQIWHRNHPLQQQDLGYTSYLHGSHPQFDPYNPYLIPQVSSPTVISGFGAPHAQTVPNYPAYGYWEPPKATLPFAVNHYLQTQTVTQPIHAPSQPTYPTLPASVHPLYHNPPPPPPYQPYYPNHIRQEPPEIDPFLPTMKQMRLDFTNFGGGDPLQWLNEAEQYFELYQIPEGRKVSIAAMHLIDDAADVWHLFKHQYPGTWQGFAELLMREFGAHNRTDCQAALAKLSQTGTVTEFKSQFNKLSRRAGGFSDDLLLACFVGGLKDDIKVDVRAMRPTSLYQAYELAMVYEERHSGHRQNRPPPPRPPFQPTFSNQRPPTQVATASRSIGTQPSSQVARNTSFQSNPSKDRKWSQNEYHDRRAKGLCFFCDEPYKGGHVCKKPFNQGQALLIEGASETDTGSRSNSPPLRIEEIESEDALSEKNSDEAAITLHVIHGEDRPQTMQLKGKFNDKEVHVLIDGGATHSFIHPCLLKNLKVPIEASPTLRVIVASGLEMCTKGRVQIVMQLQQTMIHTEFYILPVNGCEVLLGAS